MLRGMVFTLAILIFQPLTVWAEDYYFGLYAARSTYDEPGYNFDVSTFGGKIGYQWNKYLGVEIQGGFGGDDEIAGPTDTVCFDMNWIASTFVKARWSPVPDDRIQLYALAGFSTLEMDVSVGSTNSKSTENGISYGIGIDLFADQLNGMYVQYGRYLDGTLRGVDYTVDIMTLGYIRNF